MTIATPASRLFADDDEENWDLLLHGEEIGLHPILDRIVSDILSLANTVVASNSSINSHSQSSSPPFLLLDPSIWEKLSSIGFPISYKYQPPSDGNRSGPPGSKWSTHSVNEVVAFLETNVVGKNHVQAAAALLGISNGHAIDMTVAVLAKYQPEMTTTTHAAPSQWIGTLSLLSAMVEYVAAQKLARLRIFAELLRTGKIQTSSSEIIDSMVLVQEQPRGILVWLLAILCQPEPTLQRDAFVPAQALCQQVPNDASNLWNHWVRECMQRQREYVWEERSEAMECLLVLCFDTIPYLRRCDVALMWTCFQSQHWFASSSSSSSSILSRRLAKLAGLVAVETVALWRIWDTSPPLVFTETNHDASSIENIHPQRDWRTEHPLFAVSNTVDQTRRDSELQALTTLLMQSVTEIPLRWQIDPTADTPEALALLALGLLLHASRTGNHNDNNIDNEGWKQLASTGFEMAKRANAEYDVFGYAQTVLEEMVVPFVRACDPLRPTLPYDWLTLQDDTKAITAMSDASSGPTINNDLTAPSLAYASIGRELITAAILAFQEYLLPVQKLPQSANVGRLADLVAVIFRNSPTLCERFWSDWQTFTSDMDIRRFPLCHLFHSAHRLAVAALEARGRFSDAEVLPAITPLVQMAAALMHHPDIAEEIVETILPAGLVRSALQILSTVTNFSGSETFSVCRRKVLASIHTLSRIGNTPSCRTLLRDTLEEDDNSVEGPRMLARIVTISKDRACITTVFSILADLMEGASVDWLLEVARALKQVQDDDAVWRNLFLHGNDGIQAMTRVVNGLVEQLNTLVFSLDLDDNAIIDLLSVIKMGVLTVSELLSTSLSATPGRKSIAYNSAALILHCFANTMQHLRPIAELHKWRRVQDAAMDFLDNLISILAASHGLGEAVFFYVTSPVVLGLAVSLRSVMHRSIHETAGNDDSSESMFPSFESLGKYPEKEKNRAKYLLLEKLEGLDEIALDMESARMHDWLGDGDDANAPLQAAICALRLLNWWATSLEIKLIPDCGMDVQNDQEIELGSILGLSPYRLLVAHVNLPRSIRSESLFCAAWTAAGVSVFSVLQKFLYVNNASEEGALVDAVLSVQAFDFLSNVLAHGKLARSIDKGQSDHVFRLIFQSKVFAKLLCDHYQNVQTVLAEEALSDIDKMGVSVILRYLRVLGEAADINPAFASKVLCSNNSSFAAALVDSTVEFLGKASETDLVERCTDSEWIGKLRVATGCLNICRAIWRVSRSGRANSEALDEFVTRETRLFRALSAFVFRYLETLKKLSVSGQLAYFGRLPVLAFVSIAVDLMAIELSSVERQATKICPDNYLLSSLQDAMENQIVTISQAARLFISLVDFRSFVDALNSFNIGLNVDYFMKSDSPSMRRLAMYVSGSNSLFEGDYFAMSVGYDLTSAEKWIDALHKDEMSTRARSNNIFAAYQKLSNELCCLTSFASFAKVIGLFIKKLRTDLPESPLISTEQCNYSISVTQAVLREYDEMLTHIGNIEPYRALSYLQNETALFSDTIVGLLISHIQIDGFAKCLTQSEWIETVDDLARCTKKFRRITQQKTDNYFLTLGKLIVTASVLTNSSLAKDTFAISNQDLDFESKTRVSDIYIDMVSIACKTIRDMADECMRFEESQRCFCSFVNFIATVTENTANDEIYTCQLCLLFEKFSLVQTLVSYTICCRKRYAVGEFSNFSHEIVQCVLRLLTSLAASCNPRMLFLIANSEVALLVTSCKPATDLSSSEVFVRGYKDVLKSHSSVLEGLDDPNHNVWVSCLRLLGVCLLAASKFVASADLECNGTARDIYKLCFDFVKDNKTSLLGSLKRISDVDFGGKAERDCFWTINSLREVKSILFIISELSKKEAINSFEQDSLAFFDFVDQILRVFVVFSVFLGATSASREIFWALNEFDTEDMMAVDQGVFFASLRPVFRLLAGGLQNAKHEAIRYSNFISTSFRAISKTEAIARRSFPEHWKVSEDHSSPSSKSILSLERTCRANVTNIFSFQLEIEVAECLFFAIFLLWKSHPASSSFVMFNQEELKRLDAIRLVKPGAFIAFRGRGSGWVHGLSKTPNEAIEEKSNDLMFARVLRTDTVNRQWYVHLASPFQDGAEYCVQEFQLAGIEDKTKRICTLSRSPAPDTSTGLITLSDQPSVGHLILILRWCSQIYCEKNDDFLSDGTDAMIVRLAELVSAFLGLELSIYTEIKDPNLITYSLDSQSKEISEQLLDLFADSADLGNSPEVGPANSVFMSREGRLRTVVSRDLWRLVRNQIRTYLDLAIADYARRAGNPDEGRGNHSVSMLPQQNATSSPFHQLGFN